jgi:predicted O-methyltransferase YrrM
MSSLLRRILKNIPTAVGNPRRATALLTRRVLPFSAMARDPEVYGLIASWTFGRAPRVPAETLFPGIAGTDVSLMRALDRIENVSVSVRELVVLAAIVKHSSALRILEIGTSNGHTTLNLAANADPDGRVTTVDLPRDWQGEFALSVPEVARNATDRNHVGAQFRGSALEKRIISVFADSATLDWSTLAGPFDLIFIDGCHAFDYVVRDTENALRQLTAAGIIIWHDYGTIEDVSRAVDQFADRLRIAAIRSTSLAVGLPPRSA